MTQGRIVRAAILLLALASSACSHDQHPQQDGGETSAKRNDAATGPAATGGRGPGAGGTAHDAASATRDAAVVMGDAAARPRDAAAPKSDARAEDAASRDAAEPSCDAGTISATGKTIELKPGQTLASRLGMAAAGDRVVVHAGDYPHESISDMCMFDADVWLEAAAGEAAPSFAGLDLHGCSHLRVSGLHSSATLLLEGAHDITLHAVVLDPGTASDQAALQLQGQGSGGACHHITVEDSSLANGGRTVFILGRFAAADTWNHDLHFTRNEITCGSHVCFQLSGARDAVIERNLMHGSVGSAVLTAGATHIQIRQNRFEGANMQGSAVQLASPGMEWDNYDGVENMISSAIEVSNNLILGWSNGVQFDAVRDIAIVFNTIPNGTGLRLNHRTPHDRNGNVILDGNSHLRVWNNILSSVSIASPETRPSFESNNWVIGSGGGGSGLLGGDPGFADTQNYELAASSKAVGAGLVNAETPVVDFAGRARDAQPDLGARERGASAAAACP
jgi:hypothetical protein